MQERSSEPAVPEAKRRGRPRRTEAESARIPSDEDGGSTRTAIFTAAIRHFAEYGYEGARVRQMLMEAGANMALAHYYFGSKKALYEAVVSHFLIPVLAERKARLERWQQGSGTLEARICDLFVAYVGPHYTVAAALGGRDYARLMQRAVGTPGGANIGLSSAIYDLRTAYGDELRTLTREPDATVTEFAFHALVSIMLSESQWLETEGNDPVAIAQRHAQRTARLVAGGLLPMIKK